MAKHWILDSMEKFRQQPAMVWREETVSYGQLLAMIAAWETQLQQSGVAPLESVALVGDYSPQTAALLVALIVNRNVAVPLTRGVIGAAKAQCLAIAEVEKVIEFDERDAWTVSPRPVARTAPLLQTLRESGQPGLVLFSSGSTGESKAILHSFDRILDKFQRPRPALCSLVFLLLDHIGGINTLLSILTSGGLAVSISERTADTVCKAIERWQVQLLPTSPTFLNILLMSEAHKRHDLSSLRLITYGTEPMPQATLQRVVEAFPNARLKQTYGLSETGIFPTRSSANGSLQIKLGGEGFETKVKGGTLWVKSPCAMLGYLNQPSPFDAEGWLDTSDVVETDGEWVRIIGRKSELINVGGEKVSPVEVESTILQMDNIRDVIVRGKRSPVTGNIVTACVVLHHPEDLEELKTRIQEFCLARLPRHKVPLLIEVGGVRESERFKKIRLEG